MEKEVTLTNKSDDRLLYLALDAQKALSQGKINKAKDQFKQVLSKSHAVEKNNYEVQVLGYEGLGHVYEKNQKWIDAIALYHFALGVLDDPKKTQTFADIVADYRVRLIKAIEYSEAAFLQHITGKKISARSCESYQKHQASLKCIADTANDLLKRNEAIRKRLQTESNDQEGRISYLQREQRCLEDACVSIEQVHCQISEQLRLLVKVLITEAIEQLSEWQSPMKEEDYAVICFGSLARDEATPYSDLEFAVLLADGKDTEENKNYFRVLTKLLNIKVINLHETTSRMQYIEELVEISLAGRYSESPVKAGFCFDGNNSGGRKTPLGNMEYQDVPVDKRYELIKTPKQLSEYQCEAWFNKDRHLSTVLMTANLIAGNSALLTQYQREVNTVLNTELSEGNTRVRVIANEGKDDKLNDRVIVTLRQHRALKYLRESIEEFQFRGGRFEERGHYFDAKYQLYRLPNMLIDHLSMYFKVKGRSLWKRLDEMFGVKGCVGENPEGLMNLTNAVSGVLSLRLMSYLRKGERYNQLINLEEVSEQDSAERLSQHFVVGENVLFGIYRSLIPFQYRVEEFTKILNVKVLLNNMSCYDTSEFIMGWLYSLQLQHEKAISAFEKHIREIQRLYSPIHISIAEACHNIGNAYYHLGKYKKAAVAYERVRVINLNMHGPNHVSVGVAWNNLGRVFAKQGHYAEAQVAFELSISIQVSNISAQQISVANTLLDMGNVYYDQGKYAEALKAYNHAKTIKSQIYGPSHISIAGPLNNIGGVYRAQGRWVEALEAYERAKDIKIRVHGPNHFSVAETCSNMGNVYYEQRMFTKALLAYKHAGAIMSHLYGPNHISLSGVWLNLGNIYCAQNHYADALMAYERAKVIRVMVYGPNHISLAESWLNLGNVYAFQGRYVEALSAYECTKVIQIQTHNLEHISVATTWNNIGNVYSHLGDYVEALSAFNHAKEIKLKVLGSRNITIGQTWASMGEAYIELKQFERARETYLKALIIYRDMEHCCQQFVTKMLCISYLREGNYFFLGQDRGEAARCYKKSGYSFDFTLPDSHYTFANFYYERNNLPATIEHYRILIQLNPRDVHAHHNLASMYHCRAQLKKRIHKRDEFLTALHQTEVCFQEAIKLNKNTSVLTEYAQFMLINHEQYLLENVISLLGEAIVLTQHDEGLSYGILERYTVDSYLQQLIDKYGNISFNAYLFAHYLLVKSYLLNQQQEDVKKVLVEFEKAVAIDAKKNEENIQQLELVQQTLPENSLEKIQEISVQIQAIRTKHACHEALYKRAEYLINTPLAQWLEEEASVTLCELQQLVLPSASDSSTIQSPRIEHLDKVRNLSLSSSLPKSPGREGFFGVKSKDPNCFDLDTQRTDHLILDEFSSLVDHAIISIGPHEQILISFTLFDDVKQCQVLLKELGIQDTPIITQERNVEGNVTEQLGTQQTYIIQISRIEYERIIEMRRYQKDI